MTSLIAELKARLPQAEWPVVVAALRNEAQTWAELQDSTFGLQALQAAGGERMHWSPGYLGLLRLNQAQHFEPLRATPLQAVSEKLRYEAAAAYEQLATRNPDTTHSNPDLAQATLIALALRERRRLLNGWEQLADDLSIAPTEYWKLPIACLFGLIPTQHELLENLLAADQPDDWHELALHALVSNPLTLDVQSAHLLEIIRNYELPQLMALLRSLAQVSAPLAQQAALQALEVLQEKQSDDHDGLSKIQRLLLQAEIYQISDQGSAAAPLLHSAWQASQVLQAELASKVAEANGEEAETLASVQASADLVDPKQVSSANKSNKRPAALLSAARVALKAGDDQEASRLALAALQAANQETKNENPREKAKSLYELGKLLMRLHHTQEAEQAAQAAMDRQPNDPQYATLLAEILQANGKPEESLQQAHLAAALAPEQADVRRKLALALQNLGRPQEAFPEWKAVLDLETQPSLGDWLALAEVALHSEQIDDTIKACQQALAIQPTDGTAYTLMGKAVAAQGDAPSAIDFLRRATELAPRQLEAWLALAELLRAQGQSQEAIAILHTAQQHTAPSALLQVLLADLIYAQGTIEDALPAYQYAAKLAAEQAQTEVVQHVALQLSAVQRTLGQLDAARSTLETAQKSFPGNPALARQFGSVLLASGEPKRALASLQVAMQAYPDDLDLLMDVARAQLQHGEHAAEAEVTLHTVLANKAAPVEAKALLADAIAAQGKFTEAVKQYEAALKSELASDPAWRKRLTLGKAHAQAASGKPVAALNTMESLDKEQPGDLDILRALCAAYQQAGRGEEAAQIAQKVYLGEPGSEETLVWYADLMLALGKSAEACKALRRRVRQLEANPRVTLSYGMLQWGGESRQASLETLNTLLAGNDAEILAKAAAFLLTHQAKESVAYYRRALDLAGPSLDLLDGLTQAYLQNDQIEDALKTVERSINLAPHKPKGQDLKAELLQRLGKPQAALQALNAALDMLPKDAGLLARKATLLRMVGDWGNALEVAAKAFELDPGRVAYLQSAAELAVLYLQPHRARSFFSNSTHTSNPPFELTCLRAELELEAGEEIAAAKSVANVADAHAAHPRLLALQSQLAACRGDRKQAAELLLQGLSVLPKDAEDLFASLSLAKAAEKLDDWETATRSYEAIINAQPGLAMAQFGLGRAVTLRAEWQQLCEASQATQGLPGAKALAKAAHTSAHKAFKAASSTTADVAVQTMISGWQLRAELDFAAKLDLDALPSSYPANAGEAAALVRAAYRNEEVKGVAARIKSYISAPEVLVASALYSENLDTVDQLTKAAKQLSQSAPVQALAAQTTQKADKIDLALGFIQQALALWPTQPNWQSLAGELQQQQGRLAEASQHFKLAVDLEPQQARHYFALGQAQAAAKLSSAAVLNLQKAVELQPDRADYLMALAKVHHVMGDNKQAKSLAQRAQKATPENVAALLLQAELALTEKDAVGAKSLIELALSISPKDPTALLLFGETLYALGQAADAAAVLARAAKFASDEVPILIRRAQFLPENRSLDALVKLSQKHPERAEVFFALSQMLALNGNLAEAVKAGQHAVKKAGILPAELGASIHLHLGQLLRQSGNLDQSLHHLDEAIRLKPQMLGPHLERGQVFLSRRQHRQALAAFSQAAAVAPLSPAPHFEAGMALKEAKDYAAAEHELRLAAKLAPKDRHIQRQLAAVIALNLVHHRQEVGVRL